MTTAADLALVWIFGERNTLHPIFHKTGNYIPLEDVYATDATGKGKMLSRCGLIVSVNPFGYRGTRTLEWATKLRRDHAAKFAAPCRKCFRKEK